MNSKKKKLVIRILAFLLLFLMVAGMIVPYVAAAEIQDVDLEVLEENMDIVEAIPEDMLMEALEQTIDGEDTTEITNQIADYLDTTGAITSTPKETGLISIPTLPVGFDNTEFHIFVANLETKEVDTYNLNPSNNYSLPLSTTDGYYVVFSNGYAWENVYGDVSAMNGGENMFFYIGDHASDYDFDAFEMKMNLDISLEPVENTGNYNVIKYGSRVLEDGNNVKFPTDVLEMMQPPVVEEEEIPEGQTEESNNFLSSLLGKNDNEKTEEPKKERSVAGQFVMIFVDGIGDSWILILLLVIVGFAYLAVKDKNQKEKEEKREIDQYDDDYIA